MTSEQQIILFDLPSKAPRTAWSLNPWKTRLLLNYKGLDYRTEWVEYPDIKPRLENHLPPDTANYVPYTIPTVRLPSGTYVMESRSIASAIDALHPSPPVHLDSPLLPRLEAIMRRLVPAMYPVFIPRVPETILSDASVPYWVQTRGSWFGPLDRLRQGEERAWEAMGPILREVTGLLGEVDGGVFFMGGEVSYADFVWGGYLIFCQRLGGDVFERVLAGTGNAEAHRAFLEGLAPWAERKDH